MAAAPPRMGTARRQDSGSANTSTRHVTVAAETCFGSRARRRSRGLSVTGTLCSPHVGRSRTPPRVSLRLSPFNRALFCVLPGQRHSFAKDLFVDRGQSNRSTSLSAPGPLFWHERLRILSHE